MNANVHLQTGADPVQVLLLTAFMTQLSSILFCKCICCHPMTWLVATPLSGQQEQHVHPHANYCPNIVSNHIVAVLQLSSELSEESRVGSPAGSVNGAGDDDGSAAPKKRRSASSRAFQAILAWFQVSFDCPAFLLPEKVDVLHVRESGSQ